MAPPTRQKGLLNLFDQGVAYDGWGPYGTVAGLIALALAAGAGASLLRPRWGHRLPLASAGVALLYLALFNIAEIHGFGVFESAYQHVPVVLGPGAYLGIASAAAAFLAAVGVRWSELARSRSVSAVGGLALTVGLLTAYIHPWLQLQAPTVGRGATGYQFGGIEDQAFMFAVLLACFALPLWGARTPPLPLALLVVTTLDVVLFHRAFGTVSWQGRLSVGLCLLLAVLGLLERYGRLENFRIPEEIWRVDRLPGES